MLFNTRQFEAAAKSKSPDDKTRPVKKMTQLSK